MNIMAMTDSTWVLLIGQAAILGTFLGKLIWDINLKTQERLDREQDRLDRAQLAELTLSQLQQVEAAGGKREKKIVDELIKTRSVNITALKEANGTNKKIKELQEVLISEVQNSNTKT